MTILRHTTWLPSYRHKTFLTQIFRKLLYYPPYHRKYNPIERCWGILELHWNGTKLVDVETMLAWAKSMTWRGIHPIVALSRNVYQKGGDTEYAGDAGDRSPAGAPPGVPYWDILIRPAGTS
jgi:hypothetical protein